jgi:hypothetical protein
MQRPKTPTLDKRAPILELSNAIGEFLDWLPSQGIHLAVYGTPPYDRMLFPTAPHPSELLHRYFEIDPKAEEAERRALLAWAAEEAAKPDGPT